MSLKDEFDRMNSLNDDPVEETWSGSEAVEGAYILVVDDAQTFDTTHLISELRKDYEDEDEYGYPDDFIEGLHEIPTPRIIIDKNDIDAIIENIALFGHVQVSKNFKNIKFKKDYKLTNDDIKIILKQLRTEDYTYSLESTHAVHKGTLLHVFITGKPFKLPDRVLEGITLYIKFEYNKDIGTLCVVSIHPSKNKGKHPYKEDKTMKKYMIEIVPKFEKNPTSEEFENICDSIVDAVDSHCDNQERSFHVTYPLQSDIDSGNFSYRIHIIIKSKRVLRSSELFVLLSAVHPLTLVNLQEKRFCKRANTEIYWFHEGETTYWDGGTYISPNYDLYINGSTHYTVQYVPVAIKNMYERDKQRYKGVTYMWRCTGSWDNFLKATTLDEALKEFEEYYYNLLWKSVENTRERLTEAEDSFKQFAEYRWRTK